MRRLIRHEFAILSAKAKSPGLIPRTRSLAAHSNRIGTEEYAAVLGFFWPRAASQGIEKNE